MRNLSSNPTSLLASIVFALLVAPVAAGGEGEQAASGHGDAHDGVVGPDMQANETWSHTFTRSGTFEYHCHPHPWMQATVEVLARHEGEPVEHVIHIVEPPNYENWTFDPTVLSIQVGDTVTWNNTGAVMHKVAETTAAHAEHIAGAGGTVDDDHAHDTGTDGHEHDDHEGGSNAWLWIGLAVVGGLLIALWTKRQG